MAEYQPAAKTGGKIAIRACHPRVEHVVCIVPEQLLNHNTLATPLPLQGIYIYRPQARERLRAVGEKIRPCHPLRGMGF